MIYKRIKALEYLRKGSGIPDAEFRDYQEYAIKDITDNRSRLLLVQRTGWGKSFVYFIAVRLLRDSGEGPALLISPLLSLMRNQILAAEKMGVAAATINSDNPEDWGSIEKQIEDDRVDILLISPERLANDHFGKNVLSMIASRISLLVIDEAHCISDWGHDFRPKYRLITRIVRSLPGNMRLLSTTATANDRVVEDLHEVLGSDLKVIRGNLSRPNLIIQTIRLPNQADRLAWIAGNVPRLPGSGIVYTLTVRDAELVADWLVSRGIDARSYTAKTGEERPEIETALLENRVKVLVATVALGMGFDKPDLSFVIHYQVPGSVVAYYQQIGRAGRAIEKAHCILLSGSEDEEIIDYFINSAFPKPDEIEWILKELKEPPNGLSVPELMRIVNITKARIDKAIELLSLESPAPIYKEGYKWQVTGLPLSHEFWERAERLTELRKREQSQMADYLGLEGGHMTYLMKALDSPCEEDSGLEKFRLPDAPDRELVKEAILFLKRAYIHIEPRVKWPSGGLPVYKLKGSIKENLRAEAGKALCFWGDSGWGQLVKDGKNTHGRFDDELVKACADMLSLWKPIPKPAWITSVPAVRKPDLVGDFAERLSAALHLPYSAAVRKNRETPPQKSMKNGTLQALNLDGAFSVNQGRVLSGPVLLVDDMVDSRWTMTIVAWLLRDAGVPAVFPLALARTGAGDL